MRIELDPTCIACISGLGVGVKWGVDVEVGVIMAVTVPSGMAVGVMVDVTVGVAGLPGPPPAGRLVAVGGTEVGVAVFAAVDIGAAADVGVVVDVTVGVAVFAAVDVGVAVGVGVVVDVIVGVDVGVAVGVGVVVDVIVGVAVFAGVGVCSKLFIRLKRIISQTLRLMYPAGVSVVPFSNVTVKVHFPSAVSKQLEILEWCAATCTL